MPSSPSAIAFHFSGLNPWLIRSAPNSTSTAASLPSAVFAMAQCVLMWSSVCSTTPTSLPIGSVGMCCHRSGIDRSSLPPFGCSTSPSRSLSRVVITFSKSITDDGVRAAASLRIGVPAVTTPPALPFVTLYNAAPCGRNTSLPSASFRIARKSAALLPGNWRQKPPASAAFSTVPT